MKNVEKKLQEDHQINYKINNFISNPNLKFREIVTKKYYSNGINDVFEIYKSHNELYLASPNKDEYILDIITIKNCKLFRSLKCDQNFISIVKYFKNIKNNKEYLLSVDKNNIIFIWDINNHYSLFYKIESRTSKGFISGVVIIFNIIDSLNNENNYIIFSFNCKIHTNIYSLDKRHKEKIIEKTNEYNTYYLIFWFNQKDKNNYALELSDGNIYIFNIKDNSLYCNLKSGAFVYSKNNCGFIYNKNNNDNDYLIISCSCGNIMIWDLINKNLNYNIYLYNNIDETKLYISYILQWSNKYIVVCEYFYKGFIILDIENLKIITSIKGIHTGPITCAKKFYHPIYGDSLLSSDQDNNIILWSI